jgi:DNA-directed RNA polymerase specialized sigma24 family protein
MPHNHETEIAAVFEALPPSFRSPELQDVTVCAANGTDANFPPAPPGEFGPRLERYLRQRVFRMACQEATAVLAEPRFRRLDVLDVVVRGLETFLTAQPHDPSYPSFRPRLRTLVWYAALQLLRPRRPTVPLPDDLPAPEPADPDGEERAALRGAMAAVRQSPRDAAILADWLRGRPPAEIALDRRLTPKAVYKVLDRTKARLAAELRRRGFTVSDRYGGSAVRNGR